MTLRWGFLGASRIGRRALASAVSAVPGQVLHAIAARDRGRAEDFARECGFARAYEGYAALLADPEIDVVYNALTNEAHAPWTIRALEAGKHVLCEKPLTLSAREVEQVMAAERRSGRRVMEAFCHLFHPQIARVQTLLSEGAIGKLMAMQAQFSIPLPRDRGDFHWQAALGGGALFDLGCYCVSLLGHVAGRQPRDVAAVQAMAWDVDVCFAGQLDFGDGLAGQFTCNFDGPLTQHLLLLGSTGKLLLDWPVSTKGRSVRLTLNDSVEQYEPFDPYVPMVADFVRAASGEGEMARGLAWSLAQARVRDSLRAAASRDGTINSQAMRA